MSHLLGKMLDSNGPYFDRLINDLENSTGGKFSDVDLIGQILTNVNHKIRQLNLEPGNTYSNELYQALLARYAIDNQKVNYRIFGDDFSVNQIKINFIETLNSFQLPQYLRLSDQFIIKTLSENKPNIFLRKMNFQSIDQAYKKYDFQQIFFSCYQLESESWRKRIKNYLMNNLKRGYMEESLIKFEILNPELTQQIDFEQEYFSDQLLSTIYLNPNKIDTNKGLNLVVKAMIEVQNKVDSLNKFYLLRTVANFEQSFQSWYQPNQNYVWTLAQNPVPWRGINRNFAKPKTLLNQKISQMSEQKLIYFNPYQIIINQFPDLAFWQDSTYLAFNLKNSIVSLNLFDVSHDFTEKTRNQFRYYFQQNLWEELLTNYLQNQVLADKIIHQLKTKLLEKEKK